MKTNKTYGLLTRLSNDGYFSNQSITGMEAIKMAFAGVGKPIKLVVCRVSMLNFASRKAEKTVTKNGIDNRIVSRVEIPS